jgi:hypothetical protein
LPSEQHDFGAANYDEPHEIDVSAVEISPPPEPAREEPPKAPAMSLWHKIFGAPAEQSAKLSEPSVEEPASRQSFEPRAHAPDVFSGEIRSLSGQDVTDAGFINEEIIEAASVAEDEGEPAERKRGRPRRRRRGGRGRKPGDRQRNGRSGESRVHESAGADELGGDFDDLSDDVGDLPSDEVIAESKSLDSDTDLDDTDDESPRDARARSAAQRTIPSWDDAIGFIVDANMQSRLQRRPTSRPDSRGGRSRGGRRR